MAPKQQLVLNLLSPSAKVHARWDGSFDITVDCFREVRGRTYDQEVVVKFPHLSPHELECIVASIGRSVTEQENRLSAIRGAI